MEGVRRLEPTLSAEVNPREALQVEISRRNFVWAVMLAEQYHRLPEEIRHLQGLALKQMACEYRNAVALRNMAQEWGFSRIELEGLLMKAVAEHESGVDMTRSDLCYNAGTGKYLSLRQWVEQFLNMKR